MIAIYILTPLSIILGTLSGFFNLKENPLYRIFTKGLASLLFIAVALIATYFTGASIYALLVIGALILGTIGDIYLCMNDKLALKEKANYLFFIGGACFFAGHVLFAIVYLICVPFNYYLLPAVLVIPLLLCLTLLLGKKKISLGKLTPFAFFYGIMLNLMLVVTINAFIQYPSKPFGIMSLVAGILFVLSDSSLLFKEFSHLKNNKILIYVVLVTYYVAQCLFALSILVY